MRRARFMWVSKALLTALGITVFLHLYFKVMERPIATPIAIPLTPLDRWIPTYDWMLLPYASLWLYISLSLAIVGSRVEVRAWTIAAGCMSVVGLVTFWTMPTLASVPPLDHGEHPWLAFLHSSDRPGNALPSLHVAFAAFSGLLIRQQLRLMRAPRAWLAANAIWCLAICYSTLATRQHVVWDVVAGAVFGWTFWNYYLCQIPEGHLIRQAVRRDLFGASHSHF